MSEKPKRVYYRRRYCLLEKKPHVAYVHRNIGASIIWCPKHGVLCSETLSQMEGTKQMTKKQYEKFVLKKAKK